MTKTSPSLRDVAQTAGVSLGTASRALNNKANVLPATRALVLKAAADIGYQLQIRISTTVASKINTIGVVVKRDPGEHPRLDQFNYTVLCGVEDECERLGLNLMYASLPVDEYSHATTWTPMLENGDVDGLVIIGIVFNDLAVINLIPQHIPIVMVDAAAPGLECDTILTNNGQGTYEAICYLIEQGHRFIGLIGSTGAADEHPSIRERRCGYLKALSQHGIDADYIEESQLNADSAYSATIRLLQRAPQITAIFGCNDDVSQHIIRAIKDTGRRVPHDVSVIGFDDTAFAMDAQPPLTTVRVYKELMGALAVRQLYERAADINRPSITSLIGTRLIVRESVKRFASRQSDLSET